MFRFKTEVRDDYHFPTKHDHAIPNEISELNDESWCHFYYYSATSLTEKEIGFWEVNIDKENNEMIYEKLFKRKSIKIKKANYKRLMTLFYL